MEKKKDWRKILYLLTADGVIDVRMNQVYDVIGTISLILNLVVSFAMSYDHLMAKFETPFLVIEGITITFFAVDYVLRLLSAKYHYPGQSQAKAMRSYVFSFTGIIDLLSFLPYYLPMMFPIGAAAFRLFRLVRVLRLFRINAYYDSLSVITEVLQSKKQQLLSSVYIIVVLMLAASLGMYALEHDAQPEVFANAFSGIWWSAAALLTVGYGDIYPVTFLGKALGIFITFLGVGMVAIPTGIISAGFVEKYTQMKNETDAALERDLRFVEVVIRQDDGWAGNIIKDLGLPHGLLIAAVQRKNRTIVPRGHVRIAPGDHVLLAVEAVSAEAPLALREIILRENHPWNGVEIQNINISRETMIIMVRRDEKTLIPRGDLELRTGDKIFVYSNGESVISENIK